MARRDTQWEPLETGRASVGFASGEATIHRCTVGSAQKLVKELESVEVVLERRTAARALLVWLCETRGKGARQSGKREASATKRLVGGELRSVGRMEAVMAVSVRRPRGDDRVRRSSRWTRAASGEEAVGVR